MEALCMADSAWVRRLITPPGYSACGFRDGLRGDSSVPIFSLQPVVLAFAASGCDLPLLHSPAPPAYGTLDNGCFS